MGSVFRHSNAFFKKMFGGLQKKYLICNIFTSKPHSVAGKCGHAEAGRYVWIPYMEKAFITRFVLDSSKS